MRRRRCGECAHMIQMSGMRLCVGRAVELGEDSVAEVRFYDPACELFSPADGIGDFFDEEAEDKAEEPEGDARCAASARSFTGTM